jgi:hypothetical protein
LVKVNRYWISLPFTTNWRIHRAILMQ